MNPARLLSIYILMMCSSCNWTASRNDPARIDSLQAKDTIPITQPIAVDSFLDNKDSISSLLVLDTQQVAPLRPAQIVDVRNVNPEQVVSFAETLVGTPYAYGSTNPKVGFDCSGFITYVFNHFKVAVPRSSIDFTNVGKTVPLLNAKRGDVILFTDPDFDNTNSTEVGHMGLITSNDNGTISFIHSTSGKAMSVVVTPFTEHYEKRFVRVGRIFPQNN